MHTMRLLLLFGGLLVAALSGCVTRSISDSDYDGGSRGHRAGNALYRGELSEFDVLGIDRGKTVSDQQIALALESRRPLVLKRGSGLMLVQSGAQFPDDPMVKAFGKYYNVGLFTGVPPESAGKAAAPSSESYSQALRLAAARGGYEYLVVYWGVLEAARENLATSSVSWIPIVGWVLPDERQRMRIRLKVAVVDVRSGLWEMFSPEPYDDKALSSIIDRRQTDQAQVALLKDKAYLATAEELVKRYGR